METKLDGILEELLDSNRTKNSIKKIAKRYAEFCCEEQKKICLNKAEFECIELSEAEANLGDTLVETSSGDIIVIFLNEKSILNSPIYKEEDENKC